MAVDGPGGEKVARVAGAHASSLVADPCTEHTARPGEDEAKGEGNGQKPLGGSHGLGGGGGTHTKSVSIYHAPGRAGAQGHGLCSVAALQGGGYPI